MVAEATAPIFIILVFWRVRVSSLVILEKNTVVCYNANYKEREETVGSNRSKGTLILF